jgi:hypothetical protein
VGVRDQTNNYRDRDCRKEEVWGLLQGARVQNGSHRVWSRKTALSRARQAQSTVRGQRWAGWRQERLCGWRNLKEVCEMELRWRRGDKGDRHGWRKKMKYGEA